LIYKIIMAFFATLAFAFLFNSPKKELFLCGFTGAFGWFFFELVNMITMDAALSAFVHTIAVTALSRLLSFKRKNPITVYLISGILPIVPGSGIYYTAYHVLINESSLAYSYGLETLKTAGVISLGIMAVLSLPVQMFRWISDR